MRLHVERSGAGPDLVLLHGWGAHSGFWRGTRDRLAERFRVHAVDLPGHGLSREVHCARLDDAVAAVAEAVPPQAFVCGWSLGGMVAQRLAALHPERVRGLALVASTPCFVAREDWDPGMGPQVLEDFARGLREDAPATLQRFVRLNALGGEGQREAIREFGPLLGARGTPDPAALAVALEWLREDLREDARRVAQPCVVIHGARDRVAPVGAGRWLAAHLPGARLVEIPDAAHLPFATHPDRFVGAVHALHG